MAVVTLKYSRLGCARLTGAASWPQCSQQRLRWVLLESHSSDGETEAQRGSDSPIQPWLESGFCLPPCPLPGGWESVSPSLPHCVSTQPVDTLGSCPVLQQWELADRWQAPSLEG